jgi:hypothetical protein
MNKKILILFLAYIAIVPLLCNQTFAQDYPANSIAVNIGLSNLHLLDEHATPVVFRGSAFAPSVEYNHNGRSGMNFLEVAFSAYKLSAESDNYRTDILTGHFRYSFFLLPENKRSSAKALVIAGGASVTSAFMKADYWILPATSWIKGIESWYGSHSFELAGYLSYGFGVKNQLGIKLYLPLVSNVSRPAYSSSGDYNYEENDWDVKAFGKTLFITENFLANIVLSYERHLKRNLTFTAGYDFRYAQCHEPDPINWYMNIFKLGLKYNLYSNQNEKE